MKKTDDYKSLLVIVIGFCLLGIVFKNDNMIYFGLITGVAGLISTHALQGILWVWNKIAQVLGFINSRILLSVIFYVFLFPIAILSRMGKKNGLHLKNIGNTVFDTRNHKYTKEDLEDTW